MKKLKAAFPRKMGAAQRRHHMTTLLNAIRIVIELAAAGSIILFTVWIIRNKP